MAQKQTRLAERGIEPLKCTFGDCQELQCEDGEFCEEHIGCKHCDSCGVEMEDLEYANGLGLCFNCK